MRPRKVPQQQLSTPKIQGGGNPAYGIGHRRGHARGSRCGRFCRNKRIVTRHADRQRGTLRTRGGGRRRLAGNIVPRHAAADRQGGSRAHFGGRSPVGGHDRTGGCRRDGLYHDETQGHHRFRQLDLGRPYRAYSGLQHHHGVDRHRRDPNGRGFDPHTRHPLAQCQQRPADRPRRHSLRRNAGLDQPRGRPSTAPAAPTALS